MKEIEGGGRGGSRRGSKEKDKEDHERDRRRRARRTRRRSKEEDKEDHEGDRRTRRIVKEILHCLSDMQKYRVTDIRIYDNTDIQLSSEPLDCSLSLSPARYTAPRSADRDDFARELPAGSKIYSTF